MVLVCGCVNSPENMQITMGSDKNIEKLESQNNQNSNPQPEKELQNNKDNQKDINYKEPQSDYKSPNSNPQPNKPEPEKPIKKEIKDPIVEINRIGWGNDIIFEDIKGGVELEPNIETGLMPKLSAGSFKVETKEDISITKATLEVYVKVMNPNSMGCDIEEMEIDVYGDDGKFLGSGSIKNEHLVKNSNRIMPVIVKISNSKTLKNLVELSRNDRITLTIKGQGTFRYEDRTAKEIPISCSYPVELPEKLIKLKYVLKNFEEWKKNIYVKIYGEVKKKIDNAIPNNYVEDTYGNVIHVNPENPKVGKTVKITIKNPETNEPVQRVRVWSDKVLLGKTNDYGEVDHTFLKSGNHQIIVIIGDTEYWINIYVSKLVNSDNNQGILDNRRFR
jgi:LEA14-like dessication related protein